MAIFDFRLRVQNFVIITNLHATCYHVDERADDLTLSIPAGVGSWFFPCLAGHSREYTAVAIATYYPKTYPWSRVSHLQTPEERLNCRGTCESTEVHPRNRLDLNFVCRIHVYLSLPCQYLQLGTSEYQSLVSPTLNSLKNTGKNTGNERERASINNALLGNTEAGISNP